MKIVLMCICCTLVHVPSIIMRYEPFKDVVTNKQKKTLLAIYAAALLVNLVLYHFVWVSGNMSIQFYKYDLLLFCVTLAVVNGLVLRHRAREHFFTFGLTAMIIYLLMSITAFVEARLPFDDVVWQITLNAGILCVLFAALYPLLSKLMRRTITPFLSTDSREYWKNIWFIPVAMFFASLLSFPMSEHIETPLQLVSRLMIGAATLFMCRSVSYDYEQLKKREELSRSLDRQKEYYAALSEKVDEARKSRHDFKHHTAALKAFADKKDYDGLSEYISEMAETSITQPFIPFTGNSAADGIIYHYVLLCEKEHITFETEGMLKDIQVSDMDLCVLLGNALDNAWTACKAVGENRFIHLTFRRKGMLTITVQNSFDGVVLKKNDTILSRKRKNAPGIGLSSMQDICEKYHGTMRTGYENNVFSVMLLLN